MLLINYVFKINFLSISVNFLPIGSFLLFVPQQMLPLLVLFNFTNQTFYLNVYICLQSWLATIVHPEFHNFPTTYPHKLFSRAKLLIHHYTIALLATSREIQLDSDQHYSKTRRKIHPLHRNSCLPPWLEPELVN